MIVNKIIYYLFIINNYKFCIIFGQIIYFVFSSFYINRREDASSILYDFAQQFIMFYDIFKRFHVQSVIIYSKCYKGEETEIESKHNIKTYIG